MHIFMPPRPIRDLERSGCPYIHPSKDQVKIFVQGRISSPTNGSKLIFHMRRPAKTHGRLCSEEPFENLGI